MVEFSSADAPQATLQTVTLGGSALFGTSRTTAYDSHLVPNFGGD